MSPRERLSHAPEADDDAELSESFSEEELREATALREAMERGDDAFGDALRASFRSGELPDDALEAALAKALGGVAPGVVEAPPTRVEELAAGGLRAALERNAPLPEGLALLDDLRAAVRPSELSARRNEELIARALQRDAPTARVLRFPARAVAMASGALALAAGIALLVGHGGTSPSSSSATVADAPQSPPAVAMVSRAAVAPAALIHARSTEELFEPDEKFPARGHESARIDRIARARTSELRANRYATWGVR